MPATLFELADVLLDDPGVMLRVGDDLVRLSITDHGPLGLLGVRFGRAVDAIAVPVGLERSVVLAVDRCGEAIVVDGGGDRTVNPHDATMLLDLTRRALGLPTAPCERRIAELIDAIWLDRVLRAVLDAPLGDQPPWPTLARHHPRCPSGSPASPEVLRHRATNVGDWDDLRRDVLDHTARWVPVGCALASWFDGGSMARYLLASLPEPSTLLADLHELVTDDTAARLRASVSQR